MSGQDNAIEKVIWAVADFVDSDEIEKKTARVIGLFSRNGDVNVEPVCVVDSPDPQSQLPPIREMVEQRLKRLRMKSLKPLVTIENAPNMSFSISEKVDEFLAYAEKKSADLVVVNTSARKGLSRFLMGSFAETLILHSKIPLLTVNPKVEVPSKIKTIVFPTDLSLGSESVFHRVLQLALRLNAELHIVHKLSNPSSLYVGPYGVLTNDLRSLDKESHKKAEDELEDLLVQAQKAGLKKVEAHIDSTQKAQVEAILKYGKKVEADLFAMVARSGAIESTMLGSTTRQVVRQATCPVWVLHT
jgi:nucleotide-binding universal stress UspA family protein